MSKYKCTKYEKEMLEMHSSGKSTAEIVKIFNTRFSNLGLTESYVRGAIKRYKGKQNENEQTTAKMFSENQERIQKKEKPAQKSHENQKTAEAQKNSEAKKMKESDKALIEAQIKSFSRLTKELRNTFVIFSAINEEFGKGSSRFFDFQCSA
ncbi:MAG: hypothetical protein KAS17_03535, partial [Victivallaceae bacterium]|nr:hypothetical protein [Victivallaceae bacterium]